MLGRIIKGLRPGSGPSRGSRPSRRFASSFDWLDRREVPAVVVPAGFSESGLVDNLQGISQITVAPDGRIFAARFDGVIQIIKDGQVLPAPFYKIDTRNWDASNGMNMSVQLDPNFAQNQFVYLLYRTVDTAGGPSVNRLIRVTASGDTAAPGSEQKIFDYLPLKLPDGVAAHNGGNFVFGNDGKIYIPTGDLLNAEKAQTLDNLYGKVLRINPDGSIPADNPFYNQLAGDNRAIYAYGFRNPFTIANDPATGKIFVNNVGDAHYETIDDLKPGANYGWPNIEGPTSDPAYTKPIYMYSHTDPDTSVGGTAVIGGVFLHSDDPSFPDAYNNLYYFGDYDNGWIKGLDPNTGAVKSFATGLPNGVTDFDLTPDGRLLYTSLGTGEIRQIRLVYDPEPAIDPVTDETTIIGRNAIFNANVNGLGPFAYRWQINDADLPGETGPSLAVPGDLALSGKKFRVIVTNASGSAVSNAATLTVKNDHAPVAKINLPAKVLRGRLRQGQVLTAAATGFDPEDRALKPSQFSWSLDLLHNEHVHPGLYKKAGVRSIKLRLPVHAENGTIRYQINLTVTDKTGNATTITQIINLAG